MNQAELITYFTVLGVLEPNSTSAWFASCVVFVRENNVRVIRANHGKSTIMDYPVSLEKLKEVIYEPRRVN